MEHACGALAVDGSADDHGRCEQDDVLDQVLPFGCGGENAVGETHLGQEEESQHRTGQTNEQQQERNAIESAEEQAYSDGEFPPAQHVHHNFGRSPIDRVCQKRCGGFVAERFEQSKPDEQHPQCEAVSDVAIGFEPMAEASIEIFNGGSHGWRCCYACVLWVWWYGVYE